MSSDDNGKRKPNGRGGRRPGRPRGRNDPSIPWPEIEAAFVHGITVDHDPDDTTIELPERKWPTYAQLGKRFGCSQSLIHARSKRYQWDNRRKTFQERFTEQLDEELAKDLATSTASQVAILDRFTTLFSRNLRNDGVRADNIADFDKCLRLREFLLGHADARSETNAVITLDSMQERHKLARARTVELEAVDSGIVTEAHVLDAATTALGGEGAALDVALDDVPPTPTPSTSSASLPATATPAVAESNETRQPPREVARKDSANRTPFDPLSANTSCRDPNDDERNDARRPPVRPE